MFVAVGVAGSFLAKVLLKVRFLGKLAAPKKDRAVYLDVGFGARFQCPPKAVPVEALWLALAFKSRCSSRVSSWVNGMRLALLNNSSARRLGPSSATNFSKAPTSSR